jgi:hypothetical protein
LGGVGGHGDAEGGGADEEEACGEAEANLQIPAKGRGWLVIESSAPEEDKHWSDANVRREERELKHRAPEDARRCPCPPPLTEILHQHIKEYGVASDGRLFRGEKGELMSGQTYRLRIRRLGVRVPSGALVETATTKALTSGNAGQGLRRLAVRSGRPRSGLRFGLSAEGLGRLCRVVAGRELKILWCPAIYGLDRLAPVRCSLRVPEQAGHRACHR